MNSPKLRNQSNLSNNGRKLRLNFAPIHFDDTEIVVGITPYKDKDQLRTLRQNHSGTHLFYRDGSQVLSAAIVPNVLPIGETSGQIRLSDKLYLTAALVRNALINFLHSLNRKVVEYDPIEFVAAPQKENLLTGVCPSDIPVPTWLSICPRYIAAIRTVSFDHQPMLLGLALNVRTQRCIELSCNVLLEKGVSLRGLYVSELVQPNDLRMAPYLRLLGQVQSIEGDHLRLTDAREGLELVSTSKVFLEPRREAFQRCLEYWFQERTSEIQKDLEDQLAEFRDGPTRLKQLEIVVQYLSNQSLEMMPGVRFSFQPFLSEVGVQKLPSVQMAPRTTYVFDTAGEKTDTWHDRGLNEYGPYNALTFTPSTPRVCVICQRTRKGRVEQFLYKLLNGVTVPELTRKKGSAQDVMIEA